MTEADIEGEFVRLVDTTHTEAEINALYSSYRLTAESSMLADKYRPSPPVSSSSSVAALETKQSKQDKRIQYVDKHKQLTAIDAQLRVLETVTLTQQQKKQYSKLVKSQARLAKGLKSLSKQLQLKDDDGSFLKSDAWQGMLIDWLNNQLTIVLPKAILKQKLQWKHAKWVNEKPQIRDTTSTLAKQKHATKKRDQVQLKRDNLLAKIVLFNETLKEMPLLKRPAGLSEIKTATPSLEKAIDAGLGPYLQRISGSGECPLELKRLFSLKDKVARINRGLEINRDDRMYLARYLETQERDLRKALSHTHFSPTSPDVRMDARTTDTYARRGLLTKRLLEVTELLRQVRGDMSAFLVGDKSPVSSSNVSLSSSRSITTSTSESVTVDVS